MSMSTARNLPRLAAAIAGAAALALPAAAAAKGHSEHADHPHGHGHGRSDSHHVARVHTVQYVFRGTWSGGAVQVTGGNNHVRRAGLVGQSVAFDLTDARVVVRDVNGDGARDAADLQDGDRVLVQARLPKRDPGDGPYAARKLVDKGAASAPDESDTDSSQPEPEPEQD
jgi:hypothetical protein